MNWSYSYSSDLWPALITLASVIYLGLYGWRRRNILAARLFAIACFLSVFWTLGVIFEISAVNFAAKVFWLKFQAIWQLPVAVTITCFVFQFSGLDRLLNRRNYILLFLVPLLCVLLMATNDFHHLIWAGFQMDRHVIALPGRLYWVFISFGYLAGLVNFLVLIRLSIRSPGYRLPVAIIVSGQIIARIEYILNKLDVDLIGPGESIIFVVGVVSVSYYLAFFRFHAIDPVAAARTAVLRQMREGLFVVDLQGRIVDVNPMATAILGIPEINLRQKLLAEVMPVDADVLERLFNKGNGQTDMVIGEGRSAKAFTLNLTPLRGRNDELVGHLLLLHDVTEQKQAQTRLLEQQSAVATLKERERLARELHDGVGQTLGYMGMQTQTVLKWVQRNNRGKAESILKRLVEVAKDAHADVRESILSLKADPDPGWSFIPTLNKYLERFRAIYGLQVEFSIDGKIDEDTFYPAAGVQLLRVIQEALTNARKHSGAHTLRVSVEKDTSEACVTIADDGHGYDAGRLESGDGKHFGLVFMRERMEQIGGSIQVESTPGEGTTLKLNVPIRKQRT